MKWSNFSKFLKKISIMTLRNNQLVQTTFAMLKGFFRLTRSDFSKFSKFQPSLFVKDSRKGHVLRQSGLNFQTLNFLFLGLLTVGPGERHNVFPFLTLDLACQRWVNGVFQNSCLLSFLLLSKRSMERFRVSLLGRKRSTSFDGTFSGKPARPRAFSTVW